MKSTPSKKSSSSPEFVHGAGPIRISRPQFVYQGGKPAFAIVPIEEWERIVDALDDLEDVAFLEGYQADSNQELLPAEMVDALLDGENTIRVWREHRGLSQPQLAEAAGVSKAYLAQLEAGTREPAQRVIRRLAKTLRVDIDDLIRPEPENEMARSSAAPRAGRRR